ncbi:MAG: competence/damage-inducible protein A [Planctomycetes bacterium]|nr:competence/damage-inducible protein A [Planctomycetota bacterium]
MEPTAAIVVIGNEVLSGKVEEDNGRHLVRELRELGVRVVRLWVIPDEVEVIASVVREASALADHVYTSGGVGPTHDDKTMEGVARAFGLGLARNEEFASLLRAFYGERLEDAHLRMADLPEGVELLRGPGMRIPQVKVRNVYVFPGDPAILRRKFAAVRDRFRSAPFHLLRVFTSADEGPIAALLEDAERRHPGVLVGSYPVYDDRGYRVQVTVESKDRLAVEAAHAYIREGLPPGTILAREG